MNTAFLIHNHLEALGFTLRDDVWYLDPALTHRYLTVYLDGQTLVIDAQEWRGGEGFEDEVFRGEDGIAEAVSEWTAWAKQPFVRTRWQRFWDRHILGSHLQGTPYE